MDILIVFGGFGILVDPLMVECQGPAAVMTQVLAPLMTRRPRRTLSVASWWPGTVASNDDSAE